jgi:iron(III) transport system substrate-binding protein
MGRLPITSLAFVAWFLPTPLQAQNLPDGYPAAYKQVIAAAAKEQKVVVYSSTDSASASPLLADFRALYPSIEVEYETLNSSEIYNRFLSEDAAQIRTADLLWNAAMDLQMKLVSDGHALAYHSPETRHLPRWAVYRDQAWGTTFEPVVYTYNKRLLLADAVPQTHDDLYRLVSERPEFWAGKLTMYDPEKSALGFLFITRDRKLDRNFWTLATALGHGTGSFLMATETMNEHVVSGQQLLGYNVIGSYAALAQRKYSDLGIVYPKDYTLVLSRVAIIAGTAKHPNAAKLLIDYLLSERGQKVMAGGADLAPLRDDIDGPYSAQRLTQEFSDRLKPIPVDTSIVEYLNPGKRIAFLRRWRATTHGKTARADTPEKSPSPKARR